MKLCLCAAAAQRGDTAGAPAKIMTMEDTQFDPKSDC